MIKCIAVISIVLASFAANAEKRHAIVDMEMAEIKKKLDADVDECEKNAKTNPKKWACYDNIVYDYEQKYLSRGTPDYYEERYFIKSTDELVVLYKELKANSKIARQRGGSSIPASKRVKGEVFAGTFEAEARAVAFEIGRRKSKNKYSKS